MTIDNCEIPINIKSNVLLFQLFESNETYELKIYFYIYFNFFLWEIAAGLITGYRCDLATYI